MAKYIFWLNKYRDVQKRKCVFSFLRHKSQKGKIHKFFTPDFLQKIYPNPLTIFLALYNCSLLLVYHLWTSVQWGVPIEKKTAPRIQFQIVSVKCPFEGPVFLTYFFAKTIGRYPNRMLRNIIPSPAPILTKKGYKY